LGEVDESAKMAEYAFASTFVSPALNGSIEALLRLC
jgi:hypothetical protein